MKNKQRFIFLSLGMLCAVVWFLLEASDYLKLHYPFRHVIVKGEYWHVPQESIEYIVGPYIKNGYFLANLFSLQGQLNKDLPWVASVTVSRQWPDTVVLILNQKTAMARLNRTSLISDAGQVFSPPTSTFPPDLPEFIGPVEKSTDMLDTYRLFTSVANSANLSINQLQLSSEGNWSVTLSNKIIVMLGDKDILMRFQRFIKIYTQVFLLQHREPSYVDMRYSHGMAVNWKS